MPELKKGSMANRPLAGWKWNVVSRPTKAGLPLKWLNFKEQPLREERKQMQLTKKIDLPSFVPFDRSIYFPLVNFIILVPPNFQNTSQRKWALRIIPRDEPRETDIQKDFMCISRSQWPARFWDCPHLQVTANRFFSLRMSDFQNYPFSQTPGF